MISQPKKNQEISLPRKAIQKIRACLYPFIQMTYDRVLEGSDNPWQTRFFTKLFYWIKTWEHTLIKSKIGGVSLWLPFDHQLPFILKGYPYYSSNLARIAQAIQSKYPDLTVIDIGANIGDSIALLKKQLDCAILAIEGNETFFDILTSNAQLFRNIVLVKTYLGEQNQELIGTVTENQGTAHIMIDKAGASLKNHLEITTLDQLLINYPSFNQSRLLKIDTDGFDGKILRGAKNFLLQAQPIIFFEYDPFFLNQQQNDGLSILQYLQECNYRYLLIYDNFGDFLLSLELNNIELILEIHRYMVGREGKRYYDLCAFSTKDEDIFAKAKELEVKFFAITRGKNENFI